MTFCRKNDILCRKNLSTFEMSVFDEDGIYGLGKNFG